MSALTWIRGILNRPKLTTNGMLTLPLFARGMKFGAEATFSPGDEPISKRKPQENPLTAYFESHIAGPGIWKWMHYFDVYHRHLAKFVGKDVHVLEIGIFSGGSLPMWREYFGEHAHIYGVDIEEACRSYEDERIKVLIGDQADPGFWAKVKKPCRISMW